MSQKKKKNGVSKLCIGISIGAIAVLGGSIALGVYNGSKAKFINDLKKRDFFVSDTHVVGTLEEETKKSNFSYVNCGTATSAITKEGKSMLLDTSVPTGVLINTQATNYADIYKTVDYAKELVRTYKVEGPICLIIDELVNNDNCDISSAYVMVKAFVEKMNANSCVVKIVGHDENIKKLQNEKQRAEINGECEVIKYGIGLIADDSKNKISDDYELIFGEKYVYADKNYKNLIGEEFNNKIKFYDDYTYIARFDTTVDHIAGETSFSHDNIMKYNSLSSEKVKKGQKVIVPSIYHAPYWKGVDISSYQNNIDFNKFYNVDFCIVRAGYTSEELNIPLADTYFNSNMIELNNRKIPTGAYYRTRALTADQVPSEVTVLLNQLKGHEINLPVYIDFEANQAISEAVIDEFIARVSKAGYQPGIYLNSKRLPEVQKYIGKYPIWTAGGYAYDEEQTFDSMYILNKLEKGVSIYQTSQCGSGAELGIPTYVDYNYADGNYMFEILEGQDVKVKTLN